jgi:glycosyltransferase involved in cell wall biosynthesis
MSQHTNPSDSPRVSIIMATHNRAHVIAQAIESVLGQSYPSWELIIVDDKSTDRTSDVVRSWSAKDSRILYFPRNHKTNIAGASNYGLQQARGEYVAILDDDDAWVDSSKLEKQVSFLDSHPEYGGCGGALILVDKDGVRIGQATKPLTDQAIRRKMLIANSMANSTTLFRFSLARQIGFYDETLPQFADWDFWLKLGLVSKLHNFPDYFLYYRIWGEGASFARQRQNALCGIRIVQRYRFRYPGYVFALFLAIVYFVYVYFPNSVKRIINAPLSRLKKFIFSR